MIKNSFHYVYIVKTGHFYKIGRSRNIIKRIANFYYYNPCIKIIGIYKVSDKNNLEQKLHRRFYLKNLKVLKTKVNYEYKKYTKFLSNEWFKLNLSEQQEIFEICDRNCIEKIILEPFI